MSLPLQCEHDWFVKNQDELVKQYDGKVLVIYKQQVVGVYDDTLSAYLDAKSRFIPGTFMVQECIAGQDAYTVTM